MRAAGGRLDARATHLTRIVFMPKDVFLSANYRMYAQFGYLTRMCGHLWLQRVAEALQLRMSAGEEAMNDAAHAQRVNDRARHASAAFRKRANMQRSESNRYNSELRKELIGATVPESSGADARHGQWQY
jgi:hypothetical protein